MQTSRIPAYHRSNLDGRLIWFAEMSKRGLLFHPEEAPEDIIEIASGTPLLSDAECEKVGGILRGMFAEHGNDVIEACSPVFMCAAEHGAAPES